MYNIDQKKELFEYSHYSLQLRALLTCQAIGLPLVIRETYLEVRNFFHAQLNYA